MRVRLRVDARVPDNNNNNNYYYSYVKNLVIVLITYIYLKFAEGNS